MPAKAESSCRVKALESEAQVAEARHTLGSLEDQIADLTNSFNDLVGLPLPTNTELIEPPAELSGTEVAAVSPIAALDSLPADPEVEAMAHNPEFLSAQQALSEGACRPEGSKGRVHSGHLDRRTACLSEWCAAAATKQWCHRSAGGLDDLGVRQAHRPGS